MVVCVFTGSLSSFHGYPSQETAMVYFMFFFFFLFFNQEKGTVWKHRCWYSAWRRRATDSWGERWQFMCFDVIAVLLLLKKGTSLIFGAILISLHYIFIFLCYLQRRMCTMRSRGKMKQIMLFMKMRCVTLCYCKHVYTHQCPKIGLGLIRSLIRTLIKCFFFFCFFTNCISVLTQCVWMCVYWW